jgi:hypothetical protein
MKKQLLLVIATAIFMIGSVNAQDVVIGFNFATDGDFTADSGLDGNLGYDVRAENGAAATTRTLSSTTGSTDLAATADGWDAGSDDKFWSLKFKADGYHSFKISSKQYSDATGPKEFKLQWKLSGGEWADVTGGTITIGTDWTTGVLNEVALPTEMDDPGNTSIFVRWIMTSNTSVSNATVDVAGISKIDDIVITGVPYPTPETITGFDFTDNTDVEFNADSGVEANLGYDVRAENGTAGTTRTLTYSAETSGYSASVDGWDAGMDDKFWSIKFKADGFSSMTVSSKQNSDGSGPRDFKIQYKIGSSGTWTDVVDGGITLANDWTTGVVEELSLPVEMEGNGTTSMFLRWIMTTNTSVSGADVETMGISKIDDILVLGLAPSGIAVDLYSSALMVYPNPSNGTFTVESSDAITGVEVYSITGAMVYKTAADFTNMVNVDMPNLNAGMYFVEGLYRWI